MKNYLGRNHNVDCILEMQKLPDESIDCILTDPPYKYLKNQKLEVDFDEQTFFSESKRVLKPSGFIVLFGRGPSFYRWNTILADLGFLFKEEIVWDKSNSSSPVLPVTRCHETVSIFAKKTGKIRSVKVDYKEAKKHNIDSIIADIQRLKSSLGNLEILQWMNEFLQTNVRKDFAVNNNFSKYKTTLGTEQLGNRSLTCLQTITQGMKEKTIIKELREHYTSIHPTQKPVKLLQRLMKLTTDENDIILDPFSGSCSTLIAARNINRRYIGFEIDMEYYQKGTKRLEESMF